MAPNNNKIHSFFLQSKHHSKIYFYLLSGLRMALSRENWSKKQLCRWQVVGSPVCVDLDFKALWHFFFPARHRLFPRILHYGKKKNACSLCTRYKECCMEKMLIICLPVLYWRSWVISEHTVISSQHLGIKFTTVNRIPQSGYRIIVQYKSRKYHKDIRNFMLTL